MSRVLEFPSISKGEEGAATALQPQKARTWKLSPSDFAFLWEECKQCFYLKVVCGFQRPRSILPKIFTIIDSQMKEALAKRRTNEIAPSLPAGILEYGDRWVESRAIVVPRFASTCFIRGRLDGVIRFEDGSYGVVDFKTAQAKDEHIVLYSRQLHAYAWALENADLDCWLLSPTNLPGGMEPACCLVGCNGSRFPAMMLPSCSSWEKCCRYWSSLKHLEEVVCVFGVGTGMRVGELGCSSESRYIHLFQAYTVPVKWSDSGAVLSQLKKRTC